MSYRSHFAEEQPVLLPLVVSADSKSRVKLLGLHIFDKRILRYLSADRQRRAYGPDVFWLPDTAFALHMLMSKGLSPIYQSLRAFPPALHYNCGVNYCS